MTPNKNECPITIHIKKINHVRRNSLHNSKTVTTVYSPTRIVTPNEINNKLSNNDNNHNFILNNENITIVEDTLVTREDDKCENPGCDDII